MTTEKSIFKSDVNYPMMLDFESDDDMYFVDPNRPRLKQIDLNLVF